VWENDSRLEADSLLIKETDTLQWRLFNDHRYPWLLLIPKVEGVRELFELSEAQQSQIISEANRIAQVLLSDCGVDKVNCGYLGNVVAQFHFHVVGRCETDPAWPGPVWGHSPREAMDSEQLEQQVKAWRNRLA
jgi:diadenosine tetraphosphate (Ap4A) HIT family hydrolase